MSVFLRAAENSDLPLLVKAAMKGGADVNATNADGRTALHIACAKGNVPLIRYLLRTKGIDTTILDKNGKSALELAPPGEDRHRIAMAFTKHEAYMQRRRRKGSAAEDAETKMMEENDIKESDIASPATLRKVVYCVALPFLFLIVYNGLFFALKFILISMAFYFISFAYFVSEVAMRPPWYHYQPKATQLTRVRNPSYWENWINDPKTDFMIDYEDVSFESTNNYKLRGWHVPPPAGTKRGVGVVLVHGGGRDRRAWLRHVPFIHKAGYGCLLFDLREHGLSDGNMRGFTFGMKERYDTVAACQVMRHTYGYEQICAMGTSVGGASVIMAAAIDKTIDGVIAENAITTSAALLDHQVVTFLGGYFSHRQYSIILFHIFRRLSTFWLNLRIGNKPSKHCQALHCIGDIAPRPVLLMHGTADTIVPCKHSEILYDAAKSPKELYLCENAYHCGLYNIAPDEYENHVLTFLEQLQGKAE